MASPIAADPNHVPLNVLFPEQYEESKRTIARDFAVFGAIIVLGILLGATINLAMNG